MKVCKIFDDTSGVEMPGIGIRRFYSNFLLQTFRDLTITKSVFKPLDALFYLTSPSCDFEDYADIVGLSGQDTIKILSNGSLKKGNDMDEKRITEDEISLLDMCNGLNKRQIAELSRRLKKVVYNEYNAFTKEVEEKQKAAEPSRYA